MLVRLFISSLQAGVQPTLDPSAKIFWIGPMRQSKERRDLIGVCGVHAM